MAKQDDNTVRGRRFISPKSANNFATAVKGTVRDLRNNPTARSNFKVSYTKGNAAKRTDLDDDYGECNGPEADGSCDGPMK